MYQTPHASHGATLLDSHNLSHMELEIIEQKFSYSLIDNQLTDSGIESFDCTLRKNRKSAMKYNNAETVALKSNRKVVPFDVSFVGGVFSFKLYHIDVSLHTIFVKLKEINNNFYRILIDQPMNMMKFYVVHYFHLHYFNRMFLFLKLFTKKQFICHYLI